MDLVQDARWTGPKLVVLGAISLLCFLAIIYASATIIGEHPNQFGLLDHL